MEDIQARSYDRAGGHISEITFNNGQKLEIKRNDIIIFVGPNNVGKSQSLRDIYEISANAPTHVVIDKVEFEKSNSDIRAILDKVASKSLRSNRTQYDFLGKSYNYFDFTMKNFVSNEGLGDFRDIFMILLDTYSRLSICDAVGSINLDAPKSHPIHYAAYDPDKRKWLSENFYKAFGKNLIPNTNYGATVPLSIGEPVKLKKEYDDEQERQEAYREILATYPQIQNQGDGMKSFTGILLYLMLDFYCTYLIDEPESFLHPPQAHIMGQIIGETLTDDQQAFISTHSEDIIKGLISVCPERIKIVRITREENTNHFSILDNEKFQDVWNDPLLKYSNIMSGIFHKSVVVCESDSDCKLYQIIDEFNCKATGKHSETLFVHCGGKNRMANVVRALKSLDVEVKVVPDIDVLNEKSIIKNLYEAAGGDWSDMQDNYSKFRSKFNGASENIKRSNFQNFVEEKLKESDETYLSKQEIMRIREELKTTSPWDTLKMSGESGIPAGEAKVAYNAMNVKFKGKGIFIVPVGELERFVPEVGNHGPAWVNDVLEQFPDQNDPVYDKVKDFIKQVTS